MLSTAKGKSLEGKVPTYRITVRTLRGLDLEGSGSVQASGLDGAVLALSISGSANAKVAGRADSVEVSISGSGSADMAALTARRAKIEVSGSGSVSVNAADALDVEISGSGNIRYRGSPILTSDLSGSGRVERMR